jgi:hypothetical protein
MIKIIKTLWESAHLSTEKVNALLNCSLPESLFNAGFIGPAEIMIAGVLSLAGKPITPGTVDLAAAQAVAAVSRVKAFILWFKGK